jgi:predicted transcriptional regulator/ribosome-associated translation inhibitor RaiA
LRDLASKEIQEIISSDYRIFHIDDNVSRVLGVFRETGFYEAAVESGASKGMITVRDFLQVGQPTQTKIDRIWRNTGSISNITSVLDVAITLVKSNIRAMPIVDADKIAGIASQVDIVSAMCDVKELGEHPVKEVLRSPAMSLDIDEKISFARRMMLERGFSHVPIVEYGKLVGVVTAGEIVHAFITNSSKTTFGERVGKRTSRFPGQVSEIMDRYPLLIDQDSSILDVAIKIRDTGKGASFMVNSKGEILGVVTPREIISPLISLKSIVELPIYIIGLSDEDFYEREIAEQKIRRVVMRSLKIRPDITEVSINIKTAQTRGERTRYELAGRALTPDGQINAKAEGWNLLVTFDELGKMLGKAISRTKKDTPRKSRKRRGRARR